MIEKRIILSNITSIEVHDKKVNTCYDYYPYKKKTFFNSERKEGFYGSFMPPKSVDEMKEECILIDNVAFFRPYVRIKSGSDSSFKQFWTLEECYEYVKKEFSHLKSITIK